MAIDKNVEKHAKDAYKQLLAMLDGDKWHYEKDDSALSINCSATGDDLPIDVRIKVDAERQLCVFYSAMPFTVPEEKREMMALAVSAANHGLVHGDFDYNYLNGRIIFRLSTTMRDSIIGKEMFEYMLYVSCGTVDRYNDRFLYVMKSDMTAKEIVEYIDK